MTLRGYQSAAIEKTLAALERSGSAVLQMPTGAGKTKTATEIIANHDGVVWFLCHRKEIIRQAAKAFRASGIDFGVISPAKDPETEKKYRFEPEKRVQLASVGSIGRRIADLPSPSLVVWDECQHTPADSWRALRDKTLDAKHIGLTATPERLDGAGLRDLFDDMIVGPSIDELVADGYLSKYRYFAPSEPDLSAARMRGGDYRREDLDKVMNTPVLIGDAVAEYKKSVPGKRALVFAASVDASKALVERFLSEGVPAAHVDGDTPDDERDAAVAALASGEICVLSNVEVFTEGFDIPAIDAVILMRPTRSVRLLLQMIGRALRVADGKDGAMVFDHAGLYNEHGWFADNWHWSLDGDSAKERRKALERGPRKCPECNEVRAERVEVCVCGFEFPTGREIGEFDGVLREISGKVPEGWSRLDDFCRSIGVNYRCPAVLRGRGFSSVVRVNDEVQWLIQNPPSSIPPLFRDDADDYVTVWNAAKNLSMSHSSVKVAIKNHPDIAATNGWVHLEKLTNLAEGQSIRRGNKSKDEVVSRTRFGKIVGVGHGCVSDHVGRGMPSLPNGMIEVEPALEWWKENYRPKNKAIGDGVLDESQYESPTSFAVRNGFSGAMGPHFVKAGIPVTVNGWINTALGDEWLLKEYSPRHSPPRDVEHPEHYENVRCFSRRLGYSSSWSVSKMQSKGLPCARNGWVPIQAALEWVRDNRPDIDIPPEAWPTADNDNEAATKAA